MPFKPMGENLQNLHIPLLDVDPVLELTYIITTGGSDAKIFEI